MYRMYGMPQGARDGGAAMYRMYGMPQGARDGGAATPMDDSHYYQGAANTITLYTKSHARQHSYRCTLSSRLRHIFR